MGTRDEAGQSERVSECEVPAEHQALRCCGVVTAASKPSLVLTSQGSSWVTRGPPGCCVCQHHDPDLAFSGVHSRRGRAYVYPSS